jgi:hypothetical protein
MPPIDHQKVKALSERLFEWVTPAEGGDLIAELGDTLGDHAMMRIGRDFREGFIAQRFAKRRAAKAFRLLAPEPGTATPDFELDLAGRMRRYESTEADIPGRRRSDEYRIPRRAEPMVFTDLDTMVERMRELSAEKAKKSYEMCHGLVIWVNPPAFSFQPALRWDALVRGGKPAAGAFEEVWALRGEGSLLWLNGRAQPEILGEEF